MSSLLLAQPGKPQAFSHLPLKVPYFFSFCPVSFYLLTLASYINVRCLIHSKQDNSKGQAQYSSVFTMLSFSSVFSWEYLANLITKGNVCNVSVIWWPGCIWPESDPKFTNTTKWILPIISTIFSSFLKIVNAKYQCFGNAVGYSHMCRFCQTGNLFFPNWKQQNQL